MAFNYKVGVKLAMTGNIMQQMAVLASSLTGIGVKVDQLTGKFGRLHLAVGGAVSAFAGEKVLKAVARLANYGDKIVQQQTELKTMGLTAAQIAQATRFSTRAINTIPTTTIAGNLKNLGQLTYGAGTLKTAEDIFPVVAKANAILANKVGRDVADQVWPLVKSLEMKGVLNSQNLPRFEKWVDSMTQAVIATHGVVTPKDFLRTFVYGRTSTLGWSIDFMPYLVRAIQSMGTSGAGGGGRSGPGNALMSAFAALIEGQMPTKAAMMFARLGLGTYNPLKGSAQSLTNLKGSDLFMKNPYQWVQQVLMPALAAHKVAIPNGMNDETLKKMFGSDAALAETTQRNDIIGVIAKLFRNRTASQIISEFALFGSYMQGSASMYEKDKQRQMEAMKTAFGFRALMEMSPDMRKAVMAAQYENMMEAMGRALVPIQLEVLSGLTKMFNTIANVSMDHPRAIQIMLVGIAALGAFFLTAGGIALLAAIGVGGAVVAGFVALGVAIGGLAILNWKAITDGLTSVTEKLEGWVTGFKLWVASKLGRSDYATWSQLHQHFTTQGIADRLDGKSSRQVEKHDKTLDKNSTELKHFNGLMRSFLGFISYHGPGVVGGGLVPAAYTTYGQGGFFNDGMYYPPAVRGGGAPRGPLSTNPGSPFYAGHPRHPRGHSAVGPQHWTTADINQALSGPAAGGLDVGKGLAGNAYIAATRKRFAEELKDPNKRLAFAAMLQSEGTPLPTAESAMNRSLYSHKTLMQMLHSGFYGPINRGQLPAFEARLRRNPALLEKLNRAINTALAGSDLIHGATDQGMPSDPNGRWPGGRTVLHGQVFNDWGGGPGGHSGAARWRQLFESHAQSGGGVDGMPSSAIPPRANGAHETHVHLHLDGKEIAHNTVKHMVGAGRVPPTGARMPDSIGSAPFLI